MDLKKLFGTNVKLINDEEDNMVDDKAEEERITGKIIHLEEDKGWGFITSPDIKFTRIFFHWTALQPDTLNFTLLKKHMKVDFTPKLFNETNWRAIKIKVIE